MPALALAQSNIPFTDYNARLRQKQDDQHTAGWNELIKAHDQIIFSAVIFEALRSISVFGMCDVRHSQQAIARTCRASTNGRAGRDPRRTQEGEAPRAHFKFGRPTLDIGYIPLLD
jgi:hypothetical protein